MSENSLHVRSYWRTGLCVLLLSALAGRVGAFSLEDVEHKAQALANARYQALESNLPAELNELSFADYQRICYRTDQALWARSDTPFKVIFNHQGMHFNIPVQINEVTPTGVHAIRYAPEQFDFADITLNSDALKGLGYAGFRIHYPINEADKTDDEIASFLGASYFRGVGKDQVYGTSARGLAIDTALSSGEEFPWFREFWIERPKKEDKHLVLYALLDSPSATGAYRFILRAKPNQRMDVKAVIFLRENVGKLGLAPLTSMYLYGSNQPSEQHNYRLELHDATGLQIHNGTGEWIWRPLNNPKQLSLSSFEIENPKGFGLLQRGREFYRYEDLDDRYEKRPSVWVEPLGDWGKGTIELLELPTPDETNDNIVALWNPETMPEPKKPLRFSYRLHWTMDEDRLQGDHSAWVKQTLFSPGETRQENLIRQTDDSLSLLVDFAGPSLQALDSDAPVSSQVYTDDNAELLENNLRYNPATQGWRLTLRFKVKDAKKPIEMRAALVKEGETLTETWSYQWPIGR